MPIFGRLKKRDSAFDFFDRFGDPNEASAGAVPPTIYPKVAIDAAAQIRVVQVLPGAFEDEICCRLHVVTLACTAQPSDASFSALSYTWGGFVNPASITVNGTRGFPISQNLYCCLQRIRSMNQTTWLWIDQICINQQDKLEKSLQVPRMTDIYTQAEEVIIWLGDHAPGSQPTQNKSHQLEKIIEYASFGRTDMGLCWWRRLWVLQEYSLASKEPLVQIGCEQSPWSEVCQLTRTYLEGTRSVLPSANAFGVLNDMIERFSAVRKTSEKDRTLLALAWVFPQLICFDPRDKIYGLLGLLAPDMKTMIRPDYERAEVKSVFSHATYSDISYTKSLGVMALVRQKCITANLPSWAVDFVYPQALQHIDIPIRMQSWLEYFQKPSRSWTRINPQADADVVYDAANESLSIAGLDFDQVSFTLPIVQVKSKGMSQVTSWQKLTLATIPLTSRLVLKKDEREFQRQVLAPLESQTAYKRLISGEDAYPALPVYKKDSIRQIAVETILTGWLYHEAHADDPCIENELDQDDAQPVALDGYFDHLAGDFETPGSSSSLYITSKGFVGIGPRHMHSGDRIVLPFGSRYPMLLRCHADRTWQFLGFVRLTGISNNQLQTLLPELRLRKQRYVLK